MDNTEKTDRVKHDVFEVLENEEIHFQNHVKVILKALGFECLRTIAMITDSSGVDELQESVRKTFGKGKLYERMTEKDRLAMFGPCFAEDASEFQFMPGERKLIIAASHVSKELLQQKEQTKLKIQQKNSRLVTSTTTQIVNKPKKNLVQYFAQWLANTKHPIDYQFINCKINEENLTIICKLCPAAKPFTVYIDSKGCYKVTNFVAHLKKFHGKEPRDTNGRPPSTSLNVAQTLAQTLAQTSSPPTRRNVSGAQKRQADTQDDRSSNSEISEPSSKRCSTGREV